MLKVKNLSLGDGQPKICAPLTGETQAELLDQAIQARLAGADLVEWRVDYFKEVHEIDQVLETLQFLQEALIELPLIFTFRSKEEGGRRNFFVKDYILLYEAAVSSGLVDIVDIELIQAEKVGRQFLEMIKRSQVLLLLSSHDFETTPENSVLLYRLNIMEHFGADIGKIAVMPKNNKDVLRLMELTLRAKAFVSMPLITVSMTDLGKLSRVSGYLTESVITFGAVEEKTAPGQLSLEELREVLDILNK